jgi:hypothetical protein
MIPGWRSRHGAACCHTRLSSGGTAAWLLGLDLQPNNPIEIVVPPSSGIRSRRGLSVRRCEISRSETVLVRGLRATSLLRTLSDLCLQWPAVEALIAIDMAIAAGLTDAAVLGRYTEATKGRAGTRPLRELALEAAPAESPMETRLRWLLIQAGLPRPEVQANLYDGEKRFVGRADLLYRGLDSLSSTTKAIIETAWSRTTVARTC